MLRKNKLIAVVLAALFMLFSISGVVLAQTSAKDKAEPKSWGFDQNREHRYLWYGDFDFYNKSFADLTTFALSSAATSGTVRTVTITQTHTGDGAAILEPLRVDINSAVQTGSWANAIVGAINYSGAAGDAGGGLAAAMCSEVTLPAISSPAGSYFAHDFEFNAQASYVANTGSAFNVAYLRFGLYGNATAINSFEDESYFMRIDDAFTDASGNMWYDNTLRIQIETTDWYIPLSSAEGSYTSAHPFVLTGTTTLNGNITGTGTYDQTVTNTTAGGEVGHYTYVSHITNALTGEAIGIRGNARVNTIDSPAGSVIGGKFQAGNMDVGTDLSAVRGVYTEVVNKIPSGATTWTYARGHEINMDLDQGSAGNVNTITNTDGLFVLFNLPTDGTYVSVGTGYGVRIVNEAVGGTGQALDAAIYIDDTSMSGGIHGWDYGINMSGVSGFTFADINTSSGAKIFTGSAATGDAVYAEVGANDATGSIYLSTGNGYLYIQVANAGAATDWYKVTAADAD